MRSELLIRLHRRKRKRFLNTLRFVKSRALYLRKPVAVRDLMGILPHISNEIWGHGLAPHCATIHLDNGYDVIALGTHELDVARAAVIDTCKRLRKDYWS